MSCIYDVAIHLSKENFDKLIEHEILSKYISCFNKIYPPNDTVTLYIDCYTDSSLSYYDLGVIRHALEDVPHILVYIGDNMNDNIYDEVLIEDNEYLYDYAPSIEITLKI